MEHIRAIRDGMAETFAKTRAADVTVLSSPVRFYSISTQMKTPTGRCLVNHRRPAGEKLYYIITAANPRREAADETIAAFRGWAALSAGCGKSGHPPRHRHMGQGRRL